MCEASLVIVANDTTTQQDPWFVRCEEYPAVGTSLAWDKPHVITSRGLTRRYQFAIVDGRITREDTEQIFSLGKRSLAENS